MIAWRDEAIVLSVHPQGESGAVVCVLAASHGRHAGLVRGGRSRRLRGVAMPGNRVMVAWRARLPEHLGQMTVELVSAEAARVLDDPARLAALASACALGEVALPDRIAHPATFAALSAFLGALAAESWPSVYVHWELALLRDLGYGLDLERCAATGRNDDLAFVSPRSGRAVSFSAGEAYRDRLLPLPAFLVRGGEGSPADIRAGLALTGYFLDRHVLGPHGVALPAARARLVDRFPA